MKTGSTDLRDTEVQQPKTTATLSLAMSSRAFSANSGQLDAGSTTTGSSFLPSRPPFLFCSSMSISMTSFNVVSLIAIVPESEWRMPILIVSSAALAAKALSATAPPMSAPVARNTKRLVTDMFDPILSSTGGGRRARAAGLYRNGDASAMPAKRGEIGRRRKGSAPKRAPSRAMLGRLAEPSALADRQRGARLPRMRCNVRRCMLSWRAVSETLRSHDS